MAVTGGESHTGLVPKEIVTNVGQLSSTADSYDRNRRPQFLVAPESSVKERPSLAAMRLVASPPAYRRSVDPTSRTFAIARGIRTMSPQINFSVDVVRQIATILLNRLQRYLR